MQAARFSFGMSVAMPLVPLRELAQCRNLKLGCAAGSKPVVSFGIVRGFACEVLGVVVIFMTCFESVGSLEVRSRALALSLFSMQGLGACWPILVLEPERKESQRCFYIDNVAYFANMNCLC